MAIRPSITKKLQFHLEKEEMDDFVSRVGFVTDASGSMTRHYRSGFMQHLNECLLAVGVKFDDNREMDVKMFSDSSYDLPGMTEENFENYIKDNILNSKENIWGITNYAPPIESFVKDWFSGCVEKVKKPSVFGSLFGSKTVEKYIPREEQMPGFLMFQTDGSLHDEAETIKILDFINKNLNMFIVFIAVGEEEDFTFVKKMAEIYDNVDCVMFDGQTSIDEDTLYDTLISDKVHNFFSGSV